MKNRIQRKGLEMSIEDLATVLLGEYSYTNVLLMILIVMLVIVIGYLVYKERKLNSTLDEMAREIRYIQRCMK